MEHDDLRALTAAYALDGLDPDEERALEEHVRHCAECRADLASFRETAVALATDVEPVPPPPHLREQILQTVRAERGTVLCASGWTTRSPCPLAGVPLILL